MAKRNNYEARQHRQMMQGGEVRGRQAPRELRKQIEAKKAEEPDQGSATRRYNGGFMRGSLGLFGPAEREPTFLDVDYAGLEARLFDTVGPTLAQSMQVFQRQLMQDAMAQMGLAIARGGAQGMFVHDSLTDLLPAEKTPADETQEEIAKLYGAGGAKRKVDLS